MIDDYDRCHRHQRRQSRQPPPTPSVDARSSYSNPNVDNYNGYHHQYHERRSGYPHPVNYIPCYCYRLLSTPILRHPPFRLPRDTAVVLRLYRETRIHY